MGVSCFKISLGSILLPTKYCIFQYFVYRRCSLHSPTSPFLFYQNNKTTGCRRQVGRSCYPRAFTVSLSFRPLEHASPFTSAIACCKLGSSRMSPRGLRSHHRGSFSSLWRRQKFTRKTAVFRLSRSKAARHAGLAL